MQLAKVITHHVQRGQEGVTVNHGQTPYQVSSRVFHGGSGTFLSRSTQLIHTKRLTLRTYADTAYFVS
jgi:hypothetical protein